MCKPSGLDVPPLERLSGTVTGKMGRALYQNHCLKEIWPDKSPTEMPGLMIDKNTRLLDDGEVLNGYG
jgi:hypothetical protein